MNTSLRDAARQYHAWDANVLATGENKNPRHVWRGGKDGTGADWTTTRQTAGDVDGFPWRDATGIGIVNGPGGYHTFDIDPHKDEHRRPTAIVSDAAIDALLDALRLPRDYPWVWRGQSKAGWALAFRCDDPMPPGTLPAKKNEAGVAWGWPEKDSGADWHHLELRYAHCQTVYPPSAGYQWRGEAPIDAPAAVPIHRVIAAFFTLCPPQPHTLGSIDDRTKDTIRQRFDLVAYFQHELGGEVEKDGDEVRILGHGGLLIDEAKRVWHCFEDEIGGDCFEAVSYVEYRTAHKNLNGKSAEILKKTAEYAGVVLPDRKPDSAVADTPTDSPIDRPRFTIGTEDELMTLPPLEYLDRELCLVAGAYHLIYGASGSGKTFYAVERAMRQVALGRRVLYVATEDQSNLRYYVAAWRQAHVGATGKLTWLKMPEGLDLQEYDQVAELIEAIAPYEYDHITLDTLREAHSGDENSSQDTARLNRAIQRLAATGAAVDVVHHAGVAGERPRGSTALFSNAGVVLRVEGGDEDVKINFEKLRDVPRDSLRFGFDQQDTGLVDTDGQPVIRAVLRPLGLVARRTSRLSRAQRTCLHCLALSIFADAGAKEPQIAAHTTLARRTIYEALSALKDKGYVTHSTKGDPYTITNEGRAALGPELTLPPTPSADTNSAPESQVRTSADEVRTSAVHQTGTASVVRASADTLRVRTAPHLHQHTDEAPAHPGQVEEVDLPDPLAPPNQAQLIAARHRREATQ